MLGVAKVSLASKAELCHEFRYSFVTSKLLAATNPIYRRFSRQKSKVDHYYMGYI